MKLKIELNFRYIFFTYLFSNFIYSNLLFKFIFRSNLLTALKAKDNKKSKITKSDETDNEYFLRENINKKKAKRVELEMSPEQARKSQLNSLLSWKLLNLNSESNKNQKEFKYIEIPDIAKENLADYAEDIQALLINPPWSTNENNFFNFQTFVTNFEILNFNNTQNHI